MRRLAVLALVGVTLLIPAVSPAAEDVLKLVPDSALGFVAVNRLAETNAKLLQVGRDLQAPIPDLLALLKAQAGIKEGLDEKGTALLVAMPGGSSDSPPPVLLLVPATDAQKLIDQLHPKKAVGGTATVTLWGGEFLVRSVAGYAVLAEPRHAELLAKVAPAKSVPPALVAWRAWMAENDVSLVITRDGLKAFAQTVRQGLKETEDRMGQLGDQALPALTMLKMYGQIFIAAEKELQAAAVGVRLDRQGALHVVKRLAFLSDGVVAKYVGPIAAPKEKLLAEMPAGPFVVAGGGLWPEQAIGGMGGLMTGMFKATLQIYKLSDKQAEQIGRASAETSKGVRQMAMLLSVGKKGGSLYSGAMSVMKVDDSDAFFTRYEAYIKAYNDVIKDGMGMLPPMLAKRTPIEGLPGLQVTMDYTKLLANAELAGQKEMLELMLGKGGKMMIYLVAADKQTILGGNGDVEQIRRGLKVIKKAEPSLADDKGVAQTTALLPPGAPWLAYWSPAGTVQLATRMIAAFSPEMADAIKIPEFPKTPPVGLAATTAPAEIQFYLVVPPEVIKAVGKFINGLQAM